MISQEEFLTREYIDRLYTTGQWSSHGAPIDHYIDDNQDDDDFPVECQGRKLSFDEILAHPAFRVHFEAWLPQRFRYAKEWLESDLKQCADKSDGLFLLKRTIWCNQALFDKAATEDFDIGRFWSTYNPSAYCGSECEERTIELTVSAKVSVNDIDWTETMRSRMDYTNGDMEGEIYLKENSTPIFIMLSWQDGDIACLTEEREACLKLKASQ